MKAVYVILAAVALFFAFLTMQHLAAGLRELLVASWVAAALLCMYLFARRETPATGPEDQQREYYASLRPRSRREKAIRD